MFPRRLLLPAAAVLLLAPALRAQVVVSEIMYHPVEKPAFDAAGDPVLDLTEDVHEFIELKNTGPDAVSLAGWRLQGGVDFTFGVGTSLAADGYMVVARDPARLMAVPAYALPSGRVAGPWQGNLKNSGDTVRLEDAAGRVVDAVSYSSGAPWAAGADAFGADPEWTGITESPHQYRGRSLERVSATWASNDPANWLASPAAAGPSPGRANAVSLAVPLPVVIAVRAVQDSTGSIIIRASGGVRVEASFSSGGAGVTAVQVEYFKDDINTTAEVKTTVAMTAGAGPPGFWQVVLPGQTSRSVMRYRIRADRGAGFETVSPRADDPQTWQAYFVTPVRSGTRPVYEVFISAASLSTLTANISGSPRRIMNPDPPGLPRASWGATQPAVLVRDGRVFDVRMRHHGSRYRRDPSRSAFKFQFPDYARLDGAAGIFLKDKGEEHRVASQLYRAAGLPAFRARYADLYLNSGGVLQRLEVPEMDARHFESFADLQAARFPGTPTEATGEFYKSTGVVPFETGAGIGATSVYTSSGEGPYYIGNCAPIPAKSGWTARQRYDWTYGGQMHQWIGGRDTAAMITGLWSARGDTPVAPDPNLPELRSWLAGHFDVDATLAYIAVRNWCAPIDDVTHNHFLWRRANGRWAMLPWDLDGELASTTQSVYWDEYSVPQPDTLRGPHWVKDSFLKAYREEYRRKLWLLNHTVLLPANFGASGYGGLQSFATARQANVNAQLGLGAFFRPATPVATAPAAGASLLPGATLQTSGYGHGAPVPVPVHASTTWMIREAGGTWDAPVFRATTSTRLTAQPIPFAELIFGRAYFWKCFYTDAGGHPSFESAERSFGFGTTGGPPPDVTLNEVLARSTAPDFIELFNAGPAPAELGGMGLTDDPVQGARFIFPAGTVLAAGAYRVITLDAASSFRLDGDGQTVVLLRNDGTLADAVAFGPQAADRSIGRGAAGWESGTPSPGSANLAEAPGPAAGLRFNEWMASDPDGPDWFEIMNSGNRPAALGGLRLTNGTDTTVIPALSFIGAGGFQRFAADRGAGPDHVGFKLSSSGETLTLTDAAGTVIDTVAFGPQTAGVSAGRLPDGSDTVLAFPGQPSPGAPNALMVEDIVISRLYPDLELFNQSALPVVIDGWRISDAMGGAVDYVVPAGSGAVPAGGTRLLRAAALPFALDALRGGELFLAHDGTHRSRRTYGAWDGHAWGLVGGPPGGEFVRVLPSPGTPDNVPVTGPVVVSEINYHPPDLPGDDGSYEFVEWLNTSAGPVDLSGWRLAGDADFTVPEGILLPAGGRVILAAVSPGEFLERYEAAAGALVLGPWTGGLPNATGKVRLVRRLPAVTMEGPDFGFRPEVDLESINYRDTTPWPASPDGTGSALLRDPVSGYGNSAVHWTDGAPSPGSAASANLPPTVSITSPGPGFTGAASVPIRITVAAGDADGAVKRVRLEAGGVEVGTALTAPATFTWTSMATGRHTLLATVWDGRLATASAEITVTLTNDPPMVALLAPASCARFAEGDPIPLEAAAFDPESLLARVDFLAGGIVTATTALPPWRSVWAGAPAGHHQLSARATDLTGLSRDSRPIDIFVAGLTAPAPVIACRVPAGTIGLQNYGGSLGHDFEVLAPILVTQLGVFDSGSNGLGSTLTAQLWRTQPTPQVLAALTFTAAAPGTLAAGTANRFKDLATPLVLLPGTYTMVAYGYTAAEPNGNAGAGNAVVWTTGTGAGMIRFTGGGRYGNAGQYPSNVDGGPADRYAAPTFAFTDADGDGDCLPQNWETAHGFNPADPADGGADSDGDGALNREEYAAGTDPRDATSVFRLQLMESNSAQATVRVLLPANRRAVLQVSDGLVFWTDHESVPPAATPRTLDFKVPVTARRQYFRVVASP